MISFILQMFSKIIRTVIIKIMQQPSFNYVVVNLKREYSNRIKYNKTCRAVPSFFASIWSIKKKKEEDKSLTTRDILLAKADALFDQEEYMEIYKLLNNYKNDRDVEVLWRLSRAMYKISKSKKNDWEEKKLIYDAYDLICQALVIEADHWAVQKWVAILLNKKTSYEGTKVKIQELYNIKKHMMRASELNPGDATILFMIGSLCYQLADLAWSHRKIASTFFTEPPTCSFEEALQYFEQAENVDSNFYGVNLLMIGKTFLKLNKIEEALKYLKMASEYPAKIDDDQKAKQEALKLLNSLSYTRSK